MWKAGAEDVSLGDSGKVAVMAERGNAFQDLAAGQGSSMACLVGWAVRSVAYGRAVCAAEVGWWVRGMGRCYLGHPLPRSSAKNADERGTQNGIVNGPLAQGHGVIVLRLAFRNVTVRAVASDAAAGS